MTTILVSSSKSFAKTIKKVAGQGVHTVSFDFDRMLIYSNQDWAETRVEITKGNTGAEYEQENMDWENCYNILRGAPEQPITIEIGKNHLRVIFEI